MKILVITSSFPRHHQDLAGLFVKDWARSLAAHHHTLKVLCWRGPGAHHHRPPPGIDLHFVPYGPPPLEQLFFGAGAPENLSAQPLLALMAVPAFSAMVFAAWRALRRRHFDAIVGHWLLPSGLIARLLGALTHTPSYVVGHSGGVHLLRQLPRPIARPLARVLCAGPTTMPTAALAQLLTQIAHMRTAAIDHAPMGFSPPPAGLARRPSPHLRLGFLGRLVPIKGLPTLFQALHPLTQSPPRLTLEVVGHGPRQAAWKALAPPNTVFTGPLYGDQKWQFLYRCDVLVLPSRRLPNGRHEGLPVSLLEAAATGAIPIVSEIPGVAPWLASPAHQIVEPTADAWQERLRWLLARSPAQLAALRRQSRAQVRPLAWPHYGSWWHRWLTSPSIQRTNHCVGSKGTPR